MSGLTAERKRSVGHRTQTARSTPVPVDAERGRVADAITTRIAATKRRLLEGGLLQEIEWGIPGEPDVRGRRTFTYTDIDAVIEQRPALDRGSGFTTDRSDNTVLTILDPVAITDDHTFRFGDPVHVYQIKAVDGIVQDAKPASGMPPKSCDQVAYRPSQRRGAPPY